MYPPNILMDHKLTYYEERQRCGNKVRFLFPMIVPRSTCALFSRKNGLFPLQRVTRLLTQMHCSQGWGVVDMIFLRGAAWTLSLYLTPQGKCIWKNRMMCQMWRIFVWTIKCRCVYAAEEWVASKAIWNATTVLLHITQSSLLLVFLVFCFGRHRNSFDHMSGRSKIICHFSFIVRSWNFTMVSSFLGLP